MKILLALITLLIANICSADVIYANATVDLRSLVTEADKNYGYIAFSSNPVLETPFRLNNEDQLVLTVRFAPGQRLHLDHITYPGGWLHDMFAVYGLDGCNCSSQAAGTIELLEPMGAPAANPLFGYSATGGGFAFLTDYSHFNVTDSTVSFTGFVMNTGSIRIGGQGYIDINELQFAGSGGDIRVDQMAEVPEPSSGFLIFGGVLSMLAFAALRRQRFT
jgi:hypothetical protein